jgi:hypothetical protein
MRVKRERESAARKRGGADERMREKNRSIYRVGFFLVKIMGENNVNTCTRKRMKKLNTEQKREIPRKQLFKK